jgi:hypothetical protein
MILGFECMRSFSLLWFLQVCISDDDGGGGCSGGVSTTVVVSVFLLA